MILPKNRDPRFITIRRGGRFRAPTIGSWLCGLQRALSTFCTSRVGAALGPTAPAAIQQGRAWASGEIRMFSPQRPVAMQWLRQES